jgi:hypothetical protein
MHYVRLCTMNQPRHRYTAPAPTGPLPEGTETVFGTLHPDVEARAAYVPRAKVEQIVANLEKLRDEHRHLYFEHRDRYDLGRSGGYANALGYLGDLLE